MCDFVCGTMSHAKMSLHWSVIHSQLTFEWCSGCDLEMSIVQENTQQLLLVLFCK